MQATRRNMGAERFFAGIAAFAELVAVEHVKLTKCGTHDRHADCPSSIVTMSVTRTYSAC